jgi:acetyl-CoA carboxylase biotin carboxyl carrier protein
MSTSEVLSPLPGTGYRQPSPDKAAFTEASDVIAAGGLTELAEMVTNHQDLTPDVCGPPIRIVIEDSAAMMAAEAIAVVEA